MSKQAVSFPAPDDYSAEKLEKAFTGGHQGYLCGCMRTNAGESDTNKEIAIESGEIVVRSWTREKYRGSDPCEAAGIYNAIK